MKAVIYTQYGPPDVLQLIEVEKPFPKDNEVLIKVHAASVNPVDWHFMRGTPYLLRLEAGLLKPKKSSLGADVAGVIEEVGKDVKEFKRGDEVFGSCNGSFAEYVCASEKWLVKKPANLTFEQAAAVPVAAFTALQGLRDKGQIQPGQKLLINGASGGVGTFAVQIAKSFGANVTGVCSTRNVDMVRSIGADHVIDYTQEDFTQNGQRYDLIFDLVGNRSLSKCRRVLDPNGILIIVGAPNNGLWLGPMKRALHATVISRFVSQRMLMFIALTNKKDLLVMEELLISGKVTPIIDRRYPLCEVPQAIRYLEEGHARGKVIITFGHNHGS
jgi:NADPH:quinone reductase-like Zn-dependent oxidoreductase